MGNSLFPNVRERRGALPSDVEKRQDTDSESDLAISTLMEKGYSPALIVKAVHELQKQGQTVTVDALLTIIQEKDSQATTCVKTSDQASGADNSSPEGATAMVPGCSKTSDSSQTQTGQVKQRTQHAEQELATKCKVCLDADVEVFFWPCRHAACCRACAEKIADCPICRKKIAGTENVYLS